MEKQELQGVQTREWPLAELRVVEKTDEPPVIEGHAAVFDLLSVDLGGFRERVRKGAFAKTIAEADIRALWNHDMNFVLGRTKSRTLELKEDDRGLWIRAYPPATALVQDLVLTPIRRGDVDQMSFMFDVVRQEWIENEGEMPVRDLVETRLYDVSPVTFPAYPQTDVMVRSALASVGIDYIALTQAISRSKAGGNTDADRELVRAAVEKLNSLFPSAPAESHPDESAAARAQARQSWLKRELERLAIED